MSDGRRRETERGSTVTYLEVHTCSESHRVTVPGVVVDGSGPELIGGAVRGMRVRGSDWNTPMSLSCRTLDVSVGRASIDFPALATQQRILLKQPALGSAAISFSAADWGSFLAHPLMSEALSGFAARAPAPRPSSVRFRRDGATLTQSAAIAIDGVAVQFGHFCRLERGLPTLSSHPVCLCVAQQQAVVCASLCKP